MPSSISPNMGLVVPTVSQEPGPLWATDINSCLGIIDQHNHTSGQGVPIPTAGININADLPLNSFNLTTVNTVRFQALSGSLAGTSPNLGCIYVAGVDLYYNDISGNIVRLTSGGAVNATSSGISSGTATASFSGGVLVVDSNTNTPGNIKAGSYLMGDGTTDGYFVTVQPPVLAASYSLTLPTVPASTSVLGIDSSGNIGAVTTAVAATGANQIANSRTRATGSTVAAGGVAISNSSGTFSTTSTSFVTITNLSVTITTTGRPVMIILQSDNSGNDSFLGGAYTPASNNQYTIGVDIQILNGSTVISQHSIASSFEILGLLNGIVHIPPSSIATIDTSTNGSAGTYTYTAKAKMAYVGTSYVYYTQLMAYEL